MRIISGVYGGRSIGRIIAPGVRPTTDKLRQSVFSALNTQNEFSGQHVLDLCAGTGALGFEALSRGAASCLFVEKQKVMATQIRDTANDLGIPAEKSRIFCGDILDFLHKAEEHLLPANMTDSWDCIFCDPPYAMRIINAIIMRIDRATLLHPGGLFIAEHDTIEHILMPSGWSVKNSLGFGPSQVDILRREKISNN
jgi:16S rRNA (guanine966-N2)-methyltransferase